MMPRKDTQRVVIPKRHIRLLTVGIFPRILNGNLCNTWELCLLGLANKPECVQLAVEVVVENPGLQLEKNPCTPSTKVKATMTHYC
jgi:hypothetical protein